MRIAQAASKLCVRSLGVRRAARLRRWPWRGARLGKPRILRRRSARSPSFSARSAVSSWTWIFSSKPCGTSRRHAGRATVLARRCLRPNPGGDAHARHWIAGRVRGRGALRADPGEPGGLLPALGPIGAFTGRDGAARRDPASGVGPPVLWLSTDRRLASARGLVRQPQASGSVDARGQPNQTLVVDAPALAPKQGADPRAGASTTSV